MGFTHSPLRYPGGKSFLSGLFAKVIEINDISDGIYIEPYAGGAGAALKLLYNEYVQHIVLNDANVSIFNMWYSILYKTKEFLHLLDSIPVDIENWHEQKFALDNPEEVSPLHNGFAAFYMNRCNHSGILGARPIGGLAQHGKWKMDARFNKHILMKKIRTIAMYRSRISVYNEDAVDFANNELARLARSTQKILVYYDPPYYDKGKNLYLDYYSSDDHVRLAEFLRGQEGYHWILSYNDVPIIRALYSGMSQQEISLYYFAHSVRKGKELLVFSATCKHPPNLYFTN